MPQAEHSFDPNSLPTGFLSKLDMLKSTYVSLLSCRVAIIPQSPISEHENFFCFP